MLTDPRPSLILRVMAALSSTPMEEKFIHDPGWNVDGQLTGKKITINPVHFIVDTVIHELLHVLYPGWCENYVRNRTSFLMKRLSDEERQVIYEEYLKRVKRVPEWAKRVRDERD